MRALPLKALRIDTGPRERLIRMRILEAKASRETLSRGEVEILATFAAAAALTLEPGAKAPLIVSADADLTAECWYEHSAFVRNESDREHSAVFTPALLSLR